MALPMNPRSRLFPELNPDVVQVTDALADRPAYSRRIEPPTPPPARPARQAALPHTAHAEARRGRP
jgi:hypothetical protein